MKLSEQGARARIQERFPDETPEQIEARMASVMKHGRKPTTAKALVPGTIPKEVRDARTAIRKAAIKANSHARKTDEILRRMAAESRRLLAEGKDDNRP